MNQYQAEAQALATRPDADEERSINEHVADHPAERGIPRHPGAQCA